MNRRSKASVTNESLLWMRMRIDKCKLCQSLSLLKTLYNGPMKCNHVWANSGSRDTRSTGKSEISGGLYGAPATLLQMARFLKICLTASGYLLVTRTLSNSG